jgi:hypothetical protein
MSWRGSTTVQDRIYACLPYALPMIEALPFGVVLALQFPILGLILVPLSPFIAVYGALNSILGGTAGLVIFFALYLLVVRNEKIAHFVRFNTMQALLISIAATLSKLVLDLLGITSSLAGATAIPFMVLLSVIFLGVLAASIYSIVLAIIGKYAEIPVVSNAAYAQVRY